MMFNISICLLCLSTYVLISCLLSNCRIKVLLFVYIRSSMFRMLTLIGALFIFFSNDIITYLSLCLFSHQVVSNSLQPHGLQPTRLHGPWDFPCKNIGVGCHSFSRDLPNPGIKPMSPALQAEHLKHCTTRGPIFSTCSPPLFILSFCQLNFTHCLQTSISVAQHTHTNKRMFVQICQKRDFPNFNHSVIQVNEVPS